MIEAEPAKTLPAQVSELLTPPVTSPRGRMSLSDMGRALLSYGIKTGLFALILGTLDGWGKSLQNPYTQAVVCGLVPLGVTLLHMATTDGVKPKP